MNVKELREALAAFPDDMPVVYTSDEYQHQEIDHVEPGATKRWWEMSATEVVNLCQMPAFIHGTSEGFDHGCRCSPCIRAWSEAKCIIKEMGQ